MCEKSFTGEKAEFPQKNCVKEFNLKKCLMHSKMSQSKTYSELGKLECEQLLSERKLEYAGKSLKEVKMLLIEPGLKEAVKAKLPSGNQPQPDIDTGKLVAQVPLTELTLQQKQLYSKMEKHKLETVKKR